ncbi:MAG: hypothetical protein ACFFCS_26565 [Candidatus Hodarchaeota archaeon]
MAYFMKSHADYAKNLTLSQVPDYFVKKGDDGDAKTGKFIFNTSDLDKVYGEIAKFEINWTEANPIRYHVGGDNVRLMDQYIGIGVSFREKKLIKIHDHDAYYAFGVKQELKQGRVYFTNVILANFCCDVTQRKFKVIFNIYKEHFENMKDHVLGILEGIICH